jgi:lipopolysaccharide/colanic/teichoic acid biosynthesis glycosyltransferase
MKSLLKTVFLVLGGGVVIIAGLRLLSVRPARPTNNGSNSTSADGLSFSSVKRLMDMVISGAALAALSPILGILALAVKLSSPGPVFYKATRVGRGGELIKVYKFRSMVTGADKAGPGVTTSGDARVTPIGRILRRYKLDELPQLLNVLRGDMSLVGPRPEDPRYVALYTPEQRLVLQVAPGITSPASLYYRDEETLLQGQDWETQYVQQIMPAKLEIDLNYVKNANLGEDVKIIWKTFQSMWQPEHESA